MQAASDASPYVFLSYSSKDRAWVLEIADRLEAAGVRVWVDRRGLYGGTNWDAEIVAAIEGCTALWLVASEASMRSRNVAQEIRLAWEYDRPIMPLVLQHVEMPAEIKYPLVGRQHVEVLDRPDSEWLPQALDALAELTARARTRQASVPTLLSSTAGSGKDDTQHFAEASRLPLPLTSFIGREQEVAELTQLLATHRLLTLTGPGGTGKTRLALAAATASMSAFPNGAFFVELASIQDPTLVPSAVARTLGVQERLDLTPRENVLRYLQRRQLLLVLDNYEHLLAAAGFAGELLQAGPGVTLLVTSRAPLRIAGEREYPVAPLPLPDAADTECGVLVQNPAVALFVARALATRPDFSLTSDNASAVAAICSRLDGLPLAIELAAARVRALPPAALLGRLTQRLALLTGGPRNVAARQQTLRDAIAWSYALLTPAEQHLFCRLGVFAAGCTLDLAEATCDLEDDPGLNVLDGLSVLVEHSLLREVSASAEEPRYRMMETIREFALEGLESSGEAERMRRQFAVKMLEHVPRASWGGNRAALDGELDNVRAVLGWCVESGELSLGVSVWQAVRWHMLHIGNGHEEELWRQRLLALPAAAQPSLSRAQLLVAYASYSFLTAEEQSRAANDLGEAISLARELGHKRGLAEALRFLGVLRSMQADHDAVALLSAEALPLELAGGSVTGAVVIRGALAQGALARGDVAGAAAQLEEIRALPGASETVYFAQHEAELAEARGDDARARLFWEEAVGRQLARWGELSPSRLHGLASRARVALRLGDIEAALASIADGLNVLHELGPSARLTIILSALAQVAASSGLLIESGRLLAAVELQRQTYAAEVFDLDVHQKTTIEQVRHALDEVTLARAWAAGEAMDPEASVEYGLVIVARLRQRLANPVPLGQHSSDISNLPD